MEGVLGRPVHSSQRRPVLAPGIRARGCEGLVAGLRGGSEAGCAPGAEQPHKRDSDQSSNRMRSARHHSVNTTVRQTSKIWTYHLEDHVPNLRQAGLSANGGGNRPAGSRSAPPWEDAVPAEGEAAGMAPLASAGGSLPAHSGPEGLLLAAEQLALQCRSVHCGPDRSP